MKTYSLRRHLRGIVSIGYFSLLFLFVLFDYYSISSHLENINSRNIMTLERYTEKMVQAFDIMDTTFVDLAIANTEFGELSRLGRNIDSMQGENREIRVHEIVYTEIERMKNKLLTQETISGFCLSYQNNYNRRYVFKDKMEENQIKSLADWHSTHTQGSAEVNQWELVQLRDTLYYVRYYKNQMAALSGFLNLSEFPFSFESYIKEKPQIILAYQGEPVGNEELARTLGFTENSGKYLTSGYTVYQSEVGTTPLTVYMLVRHNFWSSLGWFQILLLAFTMLSFGFAVYIYIFLRKRMVQPLQEIVDLMEQVREGQREVPPLSNINIDEFCQLDHTMRMMLQEINQLKIDAYEEKLNMQRVQMQYLKLQLKPHFFLNCLKTLNAFAANKGDEKTQEFILNISVHLRFLLRNRAILIPFREEMEFVYNYRDLQNKMTARQICLKAEFDDDILECMVPPLTIQTFVENSCKYAQNNENRQILNVKIKGVQLNVEGVKYLDFTISDDGDGYPRTILEILNRNDINIDDVESMEEVGIGIANLKKRCHLIYGECCEYLFENNNGAFSEIIIPILPNHNLLK